MRSRPVTKLLLPALLAVSLTGLGCAGGAAGGGGTAIMMTNGVKAVGSLAIEGQALVPASLIANNGGALVAGNTSRFSPGGGGSLVAGNTSRYSVQSLDEVPLANALAYLTDPAEQFYKLNGKMITTTTDAKGRYRFAAGVPAGKPVIVNVILSENRRVVGFTVPNKGVSEVNVGLSTTYVTEFLRHHAGAAGKTMADYDLSKLPALAQLTARALSSGALAVPDLNIGQISKLNMAYALVVGQNVEGLGNAWAELLGHRVLAATTLAGSGVTDSGGDGGPAIEGEFYRLKGVTMDKAGNIYLADEGNHRIRKISPDGKLSTYAGTGDRGWSGDDGPAKDAKLNFPRAVVLDRDENLYVFDSQNVRVRKIDKNGIISTFAGASESRDGSNVFFENGHGGDGGPAADAILFSPRGGAVDSKGNVYVTDGLKGTNFHTIRKIDTSGTITTIAGIPNTKGGFAGDGGDAKQAKLNYHNQLWMTPDDQLYIADTFNNCIRKIDLATNVITTVAGIGGKQAKTPVADGTPALKAELNGPYGVAVDAQGQIFISERGFHRVIAVKKDGTIVRVAGGGNTSDEGDAREIKFSEPHDLFFEPDGNLLVTDTRNAKLWRVWTKFGL